MIGQRMVRVSHQNKRSQVEHLSMYRLVMLDTGSEKNLTKIRSQFSQIKNMINFLSTQVQLKGEASTKNHHICLLIDRELSLEEAKAQL